MTLPSPWRESIKDSNFSEGILAVIFRFLVLLGETAQAIADTAKRHGFTQVVFVESLEEAVRFSYEHARTGEVVLLSPACASWDMYPNFEVRGRHFKTCVRDIIDLA